MLRRGAATQQPAGRDDAHDQGDGAARVSDGRACLEQVENLLRPWWSFESWAFRRRGFDAYTQIFAVSHAFYDRVLRGAGEEMNATDVRLLEHLLARKVAPFGGSRECTCGFRSTSSRWGCRGFRNGRTVLRRLR